MIDSYTVGKYGTASPPHNRKKESCLLLFYYKLFYLNIRRWNLELGMYLKYEVEEEENMELPC